MMREIKFRGKTPDGRWVYGDLLHAEHNFKKGIDIVTDDWKQESVDPETVGQNTDIEDVNGNEIYEGDIVKFDNSRESNTGVVVWDRCNPCMAILYTHKLTNMNRSEYDFVKCGLMRIEVIGNIHDNPELM